MQKTRDTRYQYQAGQEARSWCQIEVYRSAGGAVVVICSEDPTNPGVSVTNEAARLATAIWQEEGRPELLSWIEHYPGEAHPDRLATWHLVRFNQTSAGTLANPQWLPRTGVAVADLIGRLGAEDLPAEWRSLADDGLALDCAQCGRPLGVRAVLAGVRLCAVCQVSGTVERAGPALPSHGASVADTRVSAEAELAQARAEWKRRINAQAIRLGLSPEQRAALMQELIGDRSLWSLSATELRAVADQVEAFRSAAEVQIFLDSHPRDN